MKSIDEVDLMDDIFMNLVASDPDVGEDVCRILLSVLLQKEIGKVTVHAQRMIPGSGIESRGIRLDVEVDESDDDGRIANIYDIEPHKNKENDFGRMLRFRQAKIDSRNMKRSDNDFSHLPDLYIILITDMDYFGLDYMLYTFRVGCEEHPELEYEDGLRFLYFYTGGTKGGSESVRNMLKYIQNSKAASVVDEATKELDEYVGNVRRDPEIRGDYMTFGDRIDWEKKMSLEEGIEQGLKQGIEQGLKQGIEQGIEQGKLEMIAEMLSKGKTVEEISKFCGIDPALVLKAKETMQLV